MLFLMQPRIWLAFWAASTHCQLMSRFSHLSTSKSFSSGLLSVPSSPSLEELTVLTIIFGEFHPFCLCAFVFSLLKSLKWKNLKWKRYFIVSSLSRIIYQLQLELIIDYILLLSFLLLLSVRCSVNMVPGICQYLIWFDMSFVFHLSFPSFISVNLMTCLSCQAYLNCCLQTRQNNSCLWKRYLFFFLLELVKSTQVNYTSYLARCSFFFVF